MTVSEELYNEAVVVNSTYLPSVRTVSNLDKTLPEDHNIQNSILSGYYTSIAKALPVTLRSVIYGDNVLAADIDDIVTAAQQLMTWISTLYGTPYTTDSDWSPLVQLLELFTDVKYGDWVDSTGWNTVADWMKRITALILRYPPIHATWLMFHKNMYHNGRADKLTVIHFGCYMRKIYAVKSDGTLKWKYSTGGAIKSSAACPESGRVYIGSDDQNLYALDAAGNKRWSYGLMAAVTKTPALDSQENIYISAESVYLWKFDKDGNYQWGYAFSTGTPTSATVDENDLIYFCHGYPKKVFCIYGNKTKKWEKTLPLAVYTTPIVWNGRVYVGCNDTRLYCLNRENGGTVWSHLTGNEYVGGSWSELSIDDEGTCYGVSTATGFAKRLFAIRHDNTEKWVWTCPSTIVCSPAVGTDGKVYVTCYDGKLYCISASGSTLWSYELVPGVGYSLKSSPAIAPNGDIIIGGLDAYLHCVKSDGTLRWKYAAESGIDSSPAVI